MIRVNKILCWSLFFILIKPNAFSQSFKNNYDSLYKICFNQVLNICSDSLVNEQIFDTVKIKEDEIFLKKIAFTFKERVSQKRTSQFFRHDKHITLRTRKKRKQISFCEFLFYTNYLFGGIYYEFENGKVVTKCCVIKSSYRQFCGNQRDAAMQVIDFNFFRKNVLPIFDSWLVGSTCQSFIIEEAKEILKKINN